MTTTSSNKSLYKFTGVPKMHRPYLLDIRAAETESRAYRHVINTKPHIQYADFLDSIDSGHRSSFIRSQCRMYSRAMKRDDGCHMSLRESLLCLGDANYGQDDTISVYEALYLPTAAESIVNRLKLTGIAIGSTEFRRALCGRLRAEHNFVRGFREDDRVEWHTDMSLRDLVSVMSVQWGGNVDLRYEPVGYANVWYVTTFYTDRRWSSRSLPPDAFRMLGDVVKEFGVKCEFVKRIEMIRNQHRFYRFKRSQMPSGYIFKTKIAANRAIAQLEAKAAQLAHDYLAPGLPSPVKISQW